MELTGSKLTSLMVWQQGYFPIISTLIFFFSTNGTTASQTGEFQFHLLRPFDFILILLAKVELSNFTYKVVTFILILISTFEKKLWNCLHDNVNWNGCNKSRNNLKPDKNSKHLLVLVNKMLCNFLPLIIKYRYFGFLEISCTEQDRWQCQTGFWITDGHLAQFSKLLWVTDWNDCMKY